VRVDIQNSSPGPRPMFRSTAMAMEADMAAPPRLQPGSQKVQVTVNGTIELRVK